MRSAIYTRRRGSMTIWGVVSFGVLIAAASLVVDGALVYSSRDELQIAADAAALAGASALIVDDGTIRQRATEYAAKNTAAGRAVAIEPGDVEIGDWDPDARAFIPASQTESRGAVRVTTRFAADRSTALSLAFANVFGKGEIDMQAQATAVYRPRDIVLVLDLSGSMSDDSELRHIGRLGKDAIEAQLELMWHELGEPSYGSLTFDTVRVTQSDPNDVKEILGLDGVPYPYPSGSWNDYINYVRSHSTIRRNGYQYEYGGLTLLNYWMERRSRHDQTPDLWRTSQQPLTAVKDAVDVFMNLVEQEVDEDRIGLAIYTAANGTSLLEVPLTDDRAIIRDITRRRQAGHYHSMTNIGDGMAAAITELSENARPNAFKTVVLLTDGRANRPHDTAFASQYAIDQAWNAKAADIAVATISLGTNAQTDLMEDIADITGGLHFNVPGGGSVNAYRAELEDVFRRIAIERPLQLVQ